jgi:DUF1365 family protein
MHKRLFPKENSFTYGTYYLALKLSELDKLTVSTLNLNRKGLLSFHEKDHADGKTPLLAWAYELLKQNKVEFEYGEVVLLTLPRVLNYVFNPVSFYFCYSKENNLRAVICEVHNTFGETHNYICNVNKNIENNTIIEIEKYFHVSPFMDRQGFYKFRFDMRAEKLGIWIDHYKPDGSKDFMTSLTGNFIELNNKNLRISFWKYPLITFKTIYLIHWQALKLLAKGIKYIPKPKQKTPKTTASKITNL